MTKAILNSFLLVLLGAGLGGSVRPQDEPESELAGHMETIEGALKELRKSLREAGAEPRALEALTVLQRESIVCKSLAPALASTLPERERAALVKAFRRTMVDFISTQLELEAALLEENRAAAEATLEKLRQFEDSAHERFAPEEH